MTALAYAVTRINARDVDLSLGTVANGGGPLVALRPQALAVLKLLAARPGALVSKDDLMAAVWPNVAVTDDSLVQCITEIRKALGDDAHTVIKTVPKRGYVFEPGSEAASAAKAPAGKTRVGLIAAGLAALAAIAAFVWFPKAALAPGHVPSIAVLPFDDMSADKSLGYLGDGVAEDIISMLARAPDVMVVARNSSFTYKDKPVDLRKVGSDLGVDYVLEGSVRKEGGALRIVAQLNRAKTGEHVWAERFDKAGSDPMALQEEVTGRIIGALTGEFGQLKRAQYREAWGKDTASLEEYDYYLRGHEIYVRLTAADCRQAVQIWEEGLRKFPDSALLQVKLGFVHFSLAFSGWSEDSSADFKQAGEMVRRVLARANLSPLERRLGHWLLAYVNMQEGLFDRALTEAEKARSLAPYDAFMVGDLSIILLASGKPMQAVEWTEFAAARDPAGADYYRGIKGWALEVAGKPEESLAAMNAGSLFGGLEHFVKAIDLERLSRDGEAKMELKLGLEANAAITQVKWRETNFRSDPKILDNEVSDLAKAGLPEK